MSSPALDSLVARARQGDQVALAEYLRHFEPRLLRMVELRLDKSLRRRLDPADVLQDAWLEVVRRFDEWRGQDELPLHVWVRLITGQSIAAAQRRHLAAHMRDALREGSAPQGRPSMSSDGVADAFVASATSPSQAVAREELRQRIRAAIENLDEIDREIVAMRHFENLSNEDTAAELGIEPSAASMRFMRALVRLRPELKALGLGLGGAGAGTGA